MKAKKILTQDVLSCEKRYKLWINNMDAVPQWQKEKLLRLSNEEICVNFADKLTFGTAGIRALLGPGTDLMNEFTVCRLTSSFVKYLLLKSKENVSQKKKGVVVFCDNRTGSSVFSKFVTKVLASNGFLVLKNKHFEPLPTPFLSFVIKKLNLLAGIMITASHNEASYNGYKIYDSFGKQLSTSETNKISALFKKEEINFNLDFSYDKDKVVVLDTVKLKQDYFTAVKGLQFFPHLKKQTKIIYSNLHGATKTFTDELLKEAGYEVVIVKEQYEYDRKFPTVKAPNPELLTTFRLPLALAKKHDADLVFLNDADGDRFGVAFRESREKYKVLNGDQIGTLLLYYLLNYYQEQKKLKQNATFYSSVVSSELPPRIAKAFGCRVQRVPTGFKWVLEKVKTDVQKENYQFLFAYEEANGFLVAPKIVSDKDGIQTSLVFAEMFNFWKTNEISVPSIFKKIGQKFGFYHNKTFSFTFEAEEVERLMNLLQEKLKTKVEFCDLQILKQHYFSKAKLFKVNFSCGSVLNIRPSGTESKIKFYFNSKALSDSEAKKKAEQLVTWTKNFLKVSLQKENNSSEESVL